VRPIFVTNDLGSTALTITGISIVEPSQSGRSRLHEFVTGGTCAVGRVLAPQARCRLDVGLISPGFEYPWEYGATLAISGNIDPDPTVVDLIGRVCDPMDCDFLTRFLADDVQPKWLDFPPRPVGGSFGPLALRTVNYRGHVGNQFTATLKGGDADSFRVERVRCSDRAEKPDCTFEIVFAPRAEGFLATELVIFGPGSSVPAAFSVTGQGGTSMPPTMDVVEYQNAKDFSSSPGGHYFYTDDPVEQALVDNGSAGEFVRTGRMFNSGGTKQLCRFYGSPAPGPNAHFYTISDEECARLKSLQRVPIPADVQQWNYEGLSFAGTAPQMGASGASCPAGTVPVYRGYNNAYPPAGPKNAWDSVHRYSTNQADIQQLVTQFGWRDEGIAFCARE
jgi:hypothetical protein